MRRILVPLIMATSLALTAWVLPREAGAAPGGQPHYFKHACPPAQAGHARCHELIVTDSSLQPLAKTTPDQLPNPMYPQDFHTAYQLPCKGGSTVVAWKCTTSTYGPQIIAIVDAYNDPYVASDLNSYDSYFGLAPCPAGKLTSSSACLTIVNETGGTKLPATASGVNAGWASEIALDVESAHMTDQNAKILLIEATTSNMPDLSRAEQTAAQLGATEISNSYGAGESSLETTYDPYFDYTGIAVTVSTGDSGYGTEWPATSPYTIAVGGTSLCYTGPTHANPPTTSTCTCPPGASQGYTGDNNGTYCESAWGEINPNGGGWIGAGSGCSGFEPAPFWQPTYMTSTAYLSDSTWDLTLCGGSRADADVSAAADPFQGGAAIYFTHPDGTNPGWIQTGGTSMAAPMVAGVYALAGGVPKGTNAGQNLYVGYAQGGTSAYLHDVTSGTNSPACGTYSSPPSAAGAHQIMCEGSPGYDGPTGLGTPNGLGAF